MVSTPYLGIPRRLATCLIVRAFYAVLSMAVPPGRRRAHTASHENEDIIRMESAPASRHSYVVLSEVHHTSPSRWREGSFYTGQH